MSEGLDETDARIVAALQSDTRADLLDIAAKTGLPGTTVRDRLRAMEDRGVVRGYTALVDYGRAGYDCSVVLRLRTADDAVAAVAERLRESPRISCVYEVTDAWNLVAIGCFASREEFDCYCSGLVTDPDVDAVDGDVVTRTVKEQAPMSPLARVPPHD